MSENERGREKEIEREGRKEKERRGATLYTLYYIL